MVLILFLIDTSASMNQRTCLGTTYIDIAKGAVESFMKVGPLRVLCVVQAPVGHSIKLTRLSMHRTSKVYCNKYFPFFV